jgi:general secretion pathway protein D
MKLNKYLVGLLCGAIFSVNVFAKEQINISFKDLEINDFIKIISKITNKNILVSTKLNGKVDFISSKPVYKEDVLNILIYVLESKGYTMVENDGILRIVRLNDASKYNIPVYKNGINPNEFQMVTNVFKIDYVNVDYISSKIRHLISRSAKLVTDKESNSIILTDFIANINTVKKVIDFIATDSKKDIQIVKLKNIKGSGVISDLKNVAKNVFNEKIAKEKVVILLNKDTNAIMFIGNKKNVAFLVKYLKDIEQKGSMVEKIVEVVNLKNAEAKNISKIISSVIGQRVYKDKNEKPFASVEEESNSIILMGPKEEINYFKTLITKLDVDRQQVYVKARIIEISELRTKDVGIKYGLIAGKSSDSSGLMTMAANMGGNAVAFDTSSMGLALPSVTKGLALGATINLLNQNGAADIVSEPSLLCINNKQSSIYVGETRSIKTGTTTTSGGNVNDVYKREDIGLTLKIKPRISNGNKVLLDISTKLEDVGQTTTNGQPNTSKKDLETTAIVNNGESIILGGYIKAKKEYTIDKVPFFGDIPLLGALFRNNKEVEDKINLVIIITPYIIPKSKDLTYVRNQLAQLKLLEDRYTKETVVRLLKAKLKAKKEDLKREDTIDEVTQYTKEIEKELKDTRQKYHNKNQKVEYNNKKQLTNEQLHKKRLNEIFGI